MLGGAHIQPNINKYPIEKERVVVTIKLGIIPPNILHLHSIPFSHAHNVLLNLLCTQSIDKLDNSMSMRERNPKL